MFCTDKWKQLQYPFTRTKVPGTYQDLQDGKAYKDLSKRGGFLSIPEHVGFILCCDGVQLFKSSNQSFWPILLAISSLPPDIRMNAENLILAGVWQGTGKPPMQEMLSQVLMKIEKLYNHGISLKSQHFNGTKTVKAKLLIAVFDLPARASATSFVQFNGNYSCLYCLDKGTHIMHRQVFLPNEPHTPRQCSTIHRHAIEAEEKGTPIFGIKGTSVLSSTIDLIKGVPVDYMHAILEGVSRRILSVCLDSKNHSRRFYLGRVIEEIDKRLKRIKPPQEFRRSPRSVSSFKQWKASEFRAWLLYYCLPVLYDLLPSDYIYHLSLLVSAIHILLSDTVQINDVEIAQKQLNLFYCLVPELYGQELCTANMHILIHLTDSVHNWGPLWSYSCFGYESMNGYIRSNCHGARYVLPQLVHNIRLRQILTVKGRSIADGASPDVTRFIHSYHNKKDSSCVLEVKGRVARTIIVGPDLMALKSAGFVSIHEDSVNLPCFRIVRYKSILYTAAPKKDACRDGSFCVFKHNSELHFGSIQQFCFCGNEKVAIINLYKYIKTNIIDTIRQANYAQLTKSACNKISDYCYCVKKVKITMATPVSSICSKCIFIERQDGQMSVIITIPNMYEHH